MNKEVFIDTLRRALYGKVSEYELTDQVCYYEDYIRQEMNNGRSEQEILEELGDPRLIARTIVETSGMNAPDAKYTIEEENGESMENGVEVHTFSGWKATLIMALIVAAAIAIIVLIFGLAIYLLPIFIAIALISWLLKKIFG